MAPETHSRSHVTLARLPSGVSVETAVHTYDGASDGPTLYVQAAQHGREVNGTEALRRLHQRLDPEELSGTLVAVPVADPLTFDHVSYTTPEVFDAVNTNLNRCWPGDPSGSLHERVAASLWEYAARTDAIVDLHTGFPDYLTHVVFLEGDRASRELAEAFGTDLLLSEEADDDADEEWHRRNFGGKLRVAATRAGIPSITPELTHHRELDEDAIETGVTGLLNVLRHLGMLPGDVEENGPARLARNHLGRVAVAEAGLFRVDPAYDVGDEVSAGERLGVVYDPGTYEERQVVEADRDGILYAVMREATVHVGDTLVNVAWERD